MDAKRRCGNGREDGIWGLVWVREKGAKKRDGHGHGHRDEDADEEEGKNATDKVVSEMGWEVLHWLVTVWEKDQAEHGKGRPDQSELHSANSHLSFPCAVNLWGSIQTYMSLSSVLSDVP